MRTSPIQQTAYAVLAAVVLAVPMYLLTKPAAQPAASVAADPPTVQEDRVYALLAIRTTASPTELKVYDGDRLVYDAGEESTTIAPHTEADIILTRKPPMKASLRVEASWNGGDDMPVTVTVEPAMLESKSETRWSNGATLNDIYNFSW